ncbi:MAG: hypothetical protein M1556_01255 [Candidatus Thermoplasmatota archaeon]|jgi:hypothetical protein|nr:hypothetical protein [Candidatus Thermoplasmatota archaeon]MCL6002262.1 hypothetical protein [Candidatus Thermoplasmatota archaeon]
MKSKDKAIILVALLLVSSISLIPPTVDATAWPVPQTVTLKMWATNNSTSSSWNQTISGAQAKSWDTSGSEYYRLSYPLSLGGAVGFPEYTYNGTVNFHSSGELFIPIESEGGGNYNIGTVWANITANGVIYSWSATINYETSSSSYVLFDPFWNVPSGSVVTLLNITCSPLSGYYFYTINGNYAGTTVAYTDTITEVASQPAIHSVQGLDWGWTYNYKSVSSSFTIPSVSGSSGFTLNWTAQKTTNASYNSLSQNVQTSGVFTGSSTVSSITFDADFANNNVASYTIHYSVVVSIPTYSATFTESGLPTGTKWYVNITGQPSSGALTSPSYTVPLQNGSYPYSVQTVDKQYSPSPSSGTLTVSGSSVPESISFSLVTYSVTFTESGLPSGTEWYLNVSGQSSLSSATSTISSQFPNSSYSYSIATGNKEYSPSTSSGSFTVNGSPYSDSVTFSEVTYSVTFNESGLSSGDWFVNVSTTGQSFHEPYEVNSLTFSEPNGTYAYSIATNYKVDRPSNDSGSFMIRGIATSQSVSFSEITYPVTFTESGLPGGTRWYVNVSGQTPASSSSSVIALSLPNGTYSISISTPNKLYSTPASSGSFKVDGSPVSEDVPYSLVTYLVTFTENGLPDGAKWWVNISGELAVNSTSRSVSFHFANCTSFFTIESAGYYTGLSSGTLTVNGRNVTISVPFENITTGTGTTIYNNNTVVTYVQQNWPLFVLISMIFLLAGWALSYFVNPENRGRRKQ